MAYKRGFTEFIGNLLSWAKVFQGFHTDGIIMNKLFPGARVKKQMSH